MTIKELKNRNDYYFNCDLTKKRVLNEVADTNSFDEWSCTFISLENSARLGEKIGVEYNLCVDNGKNLSAIYKVDYNEETNCIETDYSKFVHYEIDFDNPRWKEKLENAMCKTLIEFFGW